MTAALIAGASGLVGSQLLPRLLDAPEFDQVIALGRRPLDTSKLGDSQRAKLIEKQVDLNSSESLESALGAAASGAEIFCALGTTIKKAGSQEAFRKVDLDAPLLLAKVAQSLSARQYTICTAVGADAKSSVFYNRVKGELEAALKELRFPRGVKIMHPSMLLGHREENRPIERIFGAPMKWTAPLLRGPLWKFRPIPAETVARAMFNAALKEPEGDRTYEGELLFKLGAS